MASDDKGEGATMGEKRRGSPRSGAMDGKAKRARYLKRANMSKEKQQMGGKMRGILVTCGTRQESQCTKEAIILFGQVIEDLHPELFKDEDAPAEDADMSKELEKELQGIRKRSTPSGAVFSRLDVGVHGTIFLRFDREEVDPIAVVSATLRAAKESGKSNCRYCVRFLPVQDSCYARPEDAATMCKALAERVLPAAGETKEGAKPPTFAIVFRKRNNSNVHREEYINAVAKVMPPNYKVDLTHPDWVLVLEILRNTCCAAFLPDYYQLGKYNVHTICGEAQPHEKSKSETRAQSKDGGGDAEEASKSDAPTGREAPSSTLEGEGTEPAVSKDDTNKEEGEASSATNLTTQETTTREDKDGATDMGTKQPSPQPTAPEDSNPVLKPPPRDPDAVPTTDAKDTT